ncbi:MAG TPA: carbohydrate ABC transporter permease [Candidatus Sulfomarinibacteraceae bacterium]|nr:carbohydrate ABC transporter permease [Candidatus Sulfomarinibacteraceae bacterium]
MSAVSHPTGALGKKLHHFMQRAPVRLAVILICLLWTMPTAGMFVSSFRSANAIRTSGWWTAIVHPFETAQWTMENYITVLTADGMANAFANSLIITLPSTIIPITLAAFAAYAFAWMRFPGRDLLFTTVVALLVVPLQMALIPILRLYTQLELNGTFLGTWLAHTGFGLPLAIYLLYGFISQLPHELFESAWIDGASHYTAFTRLVLPLSLPAIASFAIFQFLWVWNDLLVALVFLGTKSEVAIVTSRLSAMVGSKGEAWHLLTAGAFITMIIPLIVFFSLQRYFVRGILAGSVKG